MSSYQSSYQGFTRKGGVVAFRASQSADTIDLYIPERTPAPRLASYSRWKSSIDAAYQRDNGAYPIEFYAADMLVSQMLLGSLTSANIAEASLPWGAHHPRIWRGKYFPASISPSSPVDAREVCGSAFTQSIVASESIFDEIIALFRYVEPAPTNLGVYGHRFRELLILACTEVEAAWKGIIVANVSNPSALPELKTRHYICLKDPMRLCEWKVSLRDYPGMPVLAPFLGWSTPNTTQSLPWYDAYNKTKHD